MIREFYANAVLREDEINCWIKGHEFNIDLEDIDEVLGFEELKHDFTHYKDKMLSLEMVQSHIGGVRGKMTQHYYFSTWSEMPYIDHDVQPILGKEDDHHQ